MILRVDTSAGAPPYEQIRTQIATMIGSGVLGPGARLPTIAQLAADLGLANGTVARAYRELERDRLLVSYRRRGTFVADAPEPVRPSAVRDELDRVIDRFLLSVRQLGVDPADAVARLEGRIDR